MNVKTQIKTTYNIIVSLLRATFFFFFQAEDGIRDVAVTGVQTCALPISRKRKRSSPARRSARHPWRALVSNRQAKPSTSKLRILRSVELPTARGRLSPRDRKSTRLNSSHGYISYAVFCLKKQLQSRTYSS